MIRLIVHGAGGRMGQRVSALALADDRFETVATIGRDARSVSGDPYRLDADVIIDFSSPEGAVYAASLAVHCNAALLVGTTALSPENLRVLDNTARSRAVIVAPNTSRGVAVINHLAAEAARLLGPGFDIDIVESHHSRKRDAPSGTALRLACTLSEATRRDLPPERIHCIRSGDIVGDHTIFFAGEDQRISITHSAGSRDVFALGALNAAAWLAGRAPGRYTIEQSLGLE